MKLRLMKQVSIQSVAGEWGTVAFQPNSMLNPLYSQVATATSVLTGITSRGTALNHTNLKFLSKTGAAVIPAIDMPQPNGYDGYLAQYPIKPDPFSVPGTNLSELGKYSSYLVLGSKLTLTMMPDATNTVASNMVAGFTKLFPNLTSDGLISFQTKYGRVDESEISQLLSQKIIKRPKMIANLRVKPGLGQSFSFNYSLKKWIRTQRRAAGTPTGTTADYHGSHTGEPVNRPVCYFIIADIGVASAAKTFHFMATFDYTVRLSGRVNADDSTYTAPA